MGVILSTTFKDELDVCKRIAFFHSHNVKRKTENL